MPVFRFRLEAVLRARRIEEQEKQRVVAEIERSRLEMEERLRYDQRLIESSRHTLREELTGALALGQLRDQAGVTMQAMRRAQRLLLEIAGTHQRLETARASLLGATKQRRALELLREKQFDAWKRDLDRAENKALDELVTNRAARKDMLQ